MVSSKGSGLAAVAALLATLAAHGAAIADRAPDLDVAPSCRFQAAMALPADRQSGFQICMEQEQSAKAELDMSWSQFDLEDRAQCLDLANELADKTASYVEVLECAIMMRDARIMDDKDKAFGANTDLSVGQAH